MKRLLSTALIMGYVLSAGITHVMAKFDHPKEKGWFFFKEDPSQKGWDQCIKKIDTPQLLMEFEQMEPEQQADFCVDILKQNHPDIINDINIPAFKQNIIKGMYKNRTSEKN